MIKPASYILGILHKHADALSIGRVGVPLAGRRYFVPLLFTGRGFVCGGAKAVWRRSRPGVYPFFEHENAFHPDK